MKKIMVIGSLNMDLVAKVEKMPRVGETIFGSTFKQIPGGKGANQAAAGARLGGCIRMLGSVGEDGFGDVLIQSLQKDGVNIDGISRAKEAPTGTALIVVDGNGDNSIVVISGANFHITEQDIDFAMDKMESCEIVVLQLEVPLNIVRYALKKAKALGKYTILNPAPAVALDQEIIENVDLLIPNETELEILSGVGIHTEEDILQGARIMMEKGVKELIVTLGERGCVYVSDQTMKQYPAYKVHAVDTTAAGDSFTAAIAVGLSENKKIEEIIDFAMKVGALTVTKEGAQSSLPYRNEVENFKGE
ncbi:MAG: ribokinase [Bacillota bacterium]